MKKRQKNPEVKVGMKVRIAANQASHGFTIGSVVTLTQINTNQYGDCVAQNESGSLYNVYTTDFVLVETTKTDIELRITELREEIVAEENKLAFLVETGEELFNYEEYQAYQILKTVDTEMLTAIQKAKHIVKLLQG